MAEELTCPPGDLTIDDAELRRRIIEPSEFVADTEAFVDVRLERSRGKASYSFIGPGVSQNSSQVVNLTVPHGFNVGAATMPSGAINNPHLHYTAEVFICTRGEWRMTFGENHEQSLLMKVGDVVSIPTWIFRGFQNVGADDGWLFAVLGGDDTGGILWAPDVLREAAETGLYLSPDSSVLESANGSPPDAVRPLRADQLAPVDSYTDDELARRLVPGEALAWSERPLLSSVLPGHASAMAPAIGYGVVEDRRVRPPISNPHGFSLEWLRLPGKSSVGAHRLDASQVLLLIEGDWQVELNRGTQLVTSRPATGSVVSVPPAAWRNFVNIGTDDALAVIVSGGDAPNRVEWDAQILHAATAAGWARDASGYIAPSELLGLHP